MSSRTTYKSIGGKAIDIISPDPSATGSDLIQDNSKAIADICETLAASIATAQSLLTTLQSSLTSHTTNTSNPHSTTASQVGAYTTAQVDTALAAKATTSALTSHTSNTSNPHSVTKTQVGLGNVDNTADTAKPISTATQTELDGKLNLSGGTMSGSIDLNSDNLLRVGQINVDNISDTSGLYPRIVLSEFTTSINADTLSLLSLDGSGTTTLEMGGGTINYAGTIGADTIAEGASGHLQVYTNGGDISLGGGALNIQSGVIYMGDGSGSGGTSLYMEGGSIEMGGGVINAQDIEFPDDSGLISMAGGSIQGVGGLYMQGTIKTPASISDSNDDNWIEFTGLVANDDYIQFRAPIDMGGKTIYSCANLYISGGSITLGGGQLYMGNGGGTGGISLYMEGATLDMGGGSITNGTIELASIQQSGGGGASITCGNGFLDTINVVGSVTYMNGCALDMGDGNTVVGTIQGIDQLFFYGSSSKINMAGGIITNYTATKYADNAAALTGGLSVGDVYATASGAMRVVV